MVDTVVFLTTADVSPWTVPADWNNAANTIECIGGGGGGGGGRNAACVSNGGGGGAGGGYAKVSNQTLSGTVAFQVGTAGSAGASNTNGGAGGDTFFISSATVKGAGGGLGNSAANSGTGGSAGTNVGTSTAAGGAGATRSALNRSGGGGGAGGKNGAGNPGGTGSPNSAGGSGDAGSGGAGGTTSGGAGAIGTEYDASHGSGGGGGGFASGSGVGGAGGLYGGGGAGGLGAQAGGAGKAGLIIITYTPAGAAALVAGWLRGDDDRRPIAPRVFQPPEAAVLTPPGLLSNVQGIGWFNPLDELPRPPPKQQPGAAIALTPATLPPQIAGMAWFEPPDSYQPRRAFVQDAPAYAQIIAAPAVTVVYGWWPPVQDASRAKPLSEDRPPPLGLLPTAIASIGWFVAPEATARKVVPRSDTPALAFARFAVPVVWTQMPPEPPLRIRIRDDAISVFAPSPLAGAFGMAWFVPQEAASRGLTASYSTAPAWEPQQFTVTVAVEWIIRARRRLRR